MRFMQIESVLQTKNRSEPAKNRFSVALNMTYFLFSSDLADIEFVYSADSADRWPISISLIYPSFVFLSIS